MATTTVCEQAQRSQNTRTASWTQQSRPWLTLYGLRVKLKHGKVGEDDKVIAEPALNNAARGLRIPFRSQSEDFLYSGFGAGSDSETLTRRATSENLLASEAVYARKSCVCHEAMEVVGTAFRPLETGLSRGFSRGQPRKAGPASETSIQVKLQSSHRLTSSLAVAAEDLVEP